MPERERPTPDDLLRLKDSIVSLVQQLPSEHQASLGLVLAKGILQGDMGTWFREALRLTDTTVTPKTLVTRETERGGVAVIVVDDAQDVAVANGSDSLSIW
jgi:hypothetical protein